MPMFICWIIWLTAGRNAMNMHNTTTPGEILSERLKELAVIEAVTVSAFAAHIGISLVTAIACA